jgi:hypothetical protein
MDIEGFELFALKGAREILTACRPNVVCELTATFLRDHGQSSESLIQFMLDLGYGAFLLAVSPVGKVTATPFTPETAPVEQTEVLFSFSADPLSAGS